MPKTSRCALLLAAAIGCAALQGCTEDKALALKAATEAFRDKAVEAIDAELDLYVTKQVGRRSDLDVAQDAVRLMTAAALERKALTKGELQSAEDMLFARQQVAAGTSSLAELRDAYVEFSAAFARLPDGSAFAAKAVSCSAALGARLVHKLAIVHDDLVANPVDYSRDRSEGAAMIQAAARAGDRAAIEKASLAYLQGRKLARSDNAAVRAKLAQAIEAGQQVLALVDNYGTLSVADLIAGATRILEVRARHLNLGEDESLKRVKAIRSQLESDPKYSPVLKLPVYSIEQCKA